MPQLKIGRNPVNFGLIVVDMQNGFVSKGGSHYNLDMNVGNYQRFIPQVKELVGICRDEDIPIFYTEAMREPSGVDLLLNIHNIKQKDTNMCSGTWDAQTIDKIKPTEKDHVISKRRDSAFQDTELRVWLQSIGVNTLIFCGIDKSIWWRHHQRTHSTWDMMWCWFLMPPLLE
jgi:ureidoacrylate peracid hydrolase